MTYCSYPEDFLYQFRPLELIIDLIITHVAPHGSVVVVVVFNWRIRDAQIRSSDVIITPDDVC